MAKPGTRNRILDKLKNRVHGSTTRGDIKVVDYIPIDDISAKIIAVYRGEEPTFVEVRNWVIESTGGGMRVIADTIASYDTLPYPVISLIAELNEKRTPFSKAMEEIPSLVCVARNTYLDEDLGDTWEKRDIEGRAFLVRVEKDGIENILQSIAKFAGPRTSKVAKQIIAMPAYTNDKVRYLRPDCTVGNGTIMSVDDRGFLTIKDDSTHNVYERTQGTILEITREGAGSKDKNREAIEYFSEYLGKDLAEQMFD